MSQEQGDQEQPCLHCLMVELIDDFFAEYPPAPGGSDKVDTEEGRNHRGGRGEDKSRSGRRCWRCYRIWPGGGLAVSFAMAKAKSGIGNAFGVRLNTVSRRYRVMRLSRRSPSSRGLDRSRNEESHARPADLAAGTVNPGYCPPWMIFRLHRRSSSRTPRNRGGSRH